MRARLLIAAAIMAAPLPAVAFGDLDCIGTEFCFSGACTASVLVFQVIFDWPNNTISVTAAGETLRMTLQSPNVSPGGTSGQLSYTQTDTPNSAGLLLAFAGEDITMILALGQNAGTHHATCAALEAT